MAKEALAKISEAEAEGKAIKCKALDNAKEIVKKIDSDSEKLIAAKVSEAKSEADKILDTAGSKARFITDEASQRAQKNSESLKKKISENENDIIDGVLKRLCQH